MRSSNLPILGCLITGHEGGYDYEMYRQLRAGAVAAGAHLVVISGVGIGHVDGDPFHPMRENVALSITESGAIDGLIMCNSGYGPETSTRLMAMIERHRHVPIVSIGYLADTIPYVGLESAIGMDSLVTHLVEQHHVRRFLFVRSEPNETGEWLSRYETYCRVLGRAGIPPEEHLALFWNTEEWAERHAHRVAAIPAAARPQAIVCANESMAISMMKALLACGINIPQDILVTGFDDIEGRNTIPRLTSCRQPFEEMCARAVEMILRMVRGEPVPRCVQTSATLVVRESCGCQWKEPGATQSGKPRRIQGDGGSADDEVAGHAIAALPEEVRATHHEALTMLCRELLRCSRTAFLKNEPELFMKGLDAGIRIGTREGIAPGHWNTFLLRFAAEAAAILGQERPDSAFLVLLHRGQAFIADFMLRDADLKLGLSEVKSWHSLSFAGAMAAARTYDELAEIIEANPQVWAELRVCNIIALSQNAGEPDEGLLLFFDSKPGPADGNGKHRQARVSEIIREMLASRDEPTVLNAEMLRDAWEPVGFSVSEGDSADKWFFFRLRILLGNAIKSVSLIEQVRKQADELAAANDQLILLRAKEQEYLGRVRKDLELARRIQADFLPQELPELDGWNMAVFFQPAQEVSGDFYDLFPLPGDKVAIVVADVCGKSVSAAIFMALVRSLTRARSEGAVAPDPLKVVSYINGYIIRNHKSSNMFVTLFYGVLDRADGTLCYVNAGHPPPIITGRTNVRGRLANCGPAVGLVADAKYTLRKELLAAGDMLFAYTDGVTEAQDVKGVLLGKEKLFTVVESSLVTPQSLLDAVRRSIAEHSTGRSASDDITMLAIKRI